jgi:hypothetical protein
VSPPLETGSADPWFSLLVTGIENPVAAIVSSLYNGTMTGMEA